MLSLLFAIHGWESTVLLQHLLSTPTVPTAPSAALDSLIKLNPNHLDLMQSLVQIIPDETIIVRGRSAALLVLQELVQDLGKAGDFKRINGFKTVAELLVYSLYTSCPSVPVTSHVPMIAARLQTVGRIIVAACVTLKLVDRARWPNVIRETCGKCCGQVVEGGVPELQEAAAWVIGTAAQNERQLQLHLVSIQSSTVLPLLLALVRSEKTSTPARVKVTTPHAHAHTYSAARPARPPHPAPPCPASPRPDQTRSTPP